MQPPKDLTFAFAGKGKQPEIKPETNLFSAFKAAVASIAVTVCGPDLCEQLETQKKTLIAANSVNGTARDVRTHFALQTMILTVDKLKTGIHQGGSEGYEQVRKAQNYLDHLQKHGIA